MNIFYLHEDPQVAASYHCDKHVVKMVLETAQILSTVRHHHKQSAPYAPTHEKHPCVLWAYTSPEHYTWLWCLGYWLGVEYTKRYGKVHKCSSIIMDMKTPPHPIHKCKLWVAPPRCMPERHWRDTVVDSYQTYYREAKKDICKWKNTPTPHFMFIGE